MSPNPYPIDSAAFDPYRVVRRLGGGKQGETFLAAAPQGSHVAIKVARTAHRRDRRDMDTEIAALQAAGPAVAPQVLDYRPDAARPFVVMDYMTGGTVDDLLAGGPLGEIGTRRLAMRLAALLAALHAAGVAHGDFRGQNIIVAPGGLYAVDFGCARLRADSRREFRHHRQVDLLRLGVLIARAGTGRPPFSDDWNKAIEDYPDGKVDLGAMSGSLRTVARALLDSRPRRRPDARSVQATVQRG